MSDKRVKMGVIAGASRALRYKERNPHASEADILRIISKEIEAILKKID